MKIALLTTETTHHTYYAWKLSERFPVNTILVETRSLEPPFDTFHAFEALRDEYERDVLLAGGPRRLSDVAPVKAFETLNEPDARKRLAAERPDVIFVFGTRRLELPLSCPQNTCLNLHGGNPEYYRGLDSHLWAIYHEDFASLVTTLHHVHSGLDTGDVVFQSQLPLPPEAELHHLRAVNTTVCVELSALALAAIRSTGAAPFRPQMKRGRYYSFMPSVLKEVCVEKFKRRSARLHG